MISYDDICEYLHDDEEDEPYPSLQEMLDIYMSEALQEFKRTFNVKTVTITAEQMTDVSYSITGKTEDGKDFTIEITYDVKDDHFTEILNFNGSSYVMRNNQWLPVTETALFPEM